MEVTTTTNRIHPLMAAAAVSLTVVSLVGAAAIAGLLPNSHGAVSPARTSPAALNSSLAQQVQQQPVLSVAKQNDDYPPAVHHARTRHHVAQRKNVDYEVAQAEPAPQYSAAPVYQPAAPVAQNSPLGIGLGALVGGLVGSRVGGGNGRTLAEIAGAVGGGYVGNEIAKRNQ